jgi:hypothetical protein
MPLHPTLRTFFLGSCGHADSGLHKSRPEDSCHDAASNQVNSALSEPRPISNRLNTRRISTVPKSVQCDRNLLLDRQLRMIGIIEKDRVRLEGRDEFIECEWAHSEILSEMIWPAIFQRCEDVM